MILAASQAPILAGSPAVGQAPLAESPAFGVEHPRFTKFDLQQGLANSRALSLLQDRQGFMWLGTADGLHRYDGYDFVQYRYDANDSHSLSNNGVWALFQDHEGYLWAGTEGGLNRFDPTTETFTRYLSNPNDEKSLSNSNITTLYEDSKDILWIGTYGGGLNRFDRATNTFTHYQNDPADPHSLGGNEIRGIVEDINGTLWVGTYGGGLNQMVPGKNAGEPPTFRRFQNDPNNPKSLSNNQVQSLYADAMGELWVGTWGGGLNRFDIATETFSQYRYNPDDPHSSSSDTIVTILGDAGGNLWIGTFDAGVEYFKSASATFVHYRHNPTDPDSLSHDTVRSLYISKDNLLFVGTSGGGVNTLNLSPNPFHTLRQEPGNPNSLGQNDIRAILQDKEGQLWIGTQTSGLDRYDPSTDRFTHFRHDPDDASSLSSNTVWALLEDHEGALWVGTFGGIDKLDRKSGHFVHYRNDPANPRTLSSDRIYRLYEDRSGTLWVGAYNGLNRFDRQTESFTHFVSNPADPTTLSNGVITSIYEDNSGVLWVGTQGGLNRLDQRTGKFTRYLQNPDDPASISNNTIPDIYGDGNGVLWLATYEGLNEFDPKSGHAKHYTMKNGMSSDIIFGILPDDQGNLWLTTNNGLNRFDPRTKEIRVFDQDSGLVSPAFNAFSRARSKSGELMFGSFDGLALLSPTQIGGETHVAPLVFTDFELANRPVAIGADSVLQQAINQTTAMTLSYREQVISFSFAALDFRTPQKISYRYTLRGFDTRWTTVTSKRRYITYTNLAPGDYVFMVQSSDPSGQWITPGRAISFIITPPWWQSNWFRLAFAALVGLIVAGAYRFRVMMLQQRNRDLESQVEYRTTALQLANTDLEQRNDELSTLNHIAHTLSQTVPFESILEQMVVINANLFHATGVAICLASVDRSEMNVVDYHQVATPTSPDALTNGSVFQLATASLSGPLNLYILSLFGDGKSVIFNDTHPNSVFSPFWPVAEPSSFSHLMLAPISALGEMSGMIMVARGQSEGNFSPDEAMLAETIAHQVAVTYENSLLFDEELRQRKVAEQRSQELSTLLTVSLDVSSTNELEPLLDLILDHLAQVIDLSNVILLELGGDELFILAQLGTGSSDLSSRDEFPVEWLQEETPLFETRSPLLCADLAQDSHMLEGMSKTFGPKSASLLLKTHSCMIVPMVTRDRVVGIIWLGHSQPDCYSEAQADYVSAIAHQTAIAIENAHYFQTIQIAAADKERNRLAQELHDSVSQTLMAANRMAESLPDLWEQSPAKGKFALHQLHLMMQNSIAEMRTLMLELRPSILAQKPLSEILRQLVDAFAGRSQIPVQLHLNGDAILPAICQVYFYRIAQGALNNIMHHAQASQVTVELNCLPTHVELCIVDDGVGFDPAAVAPDRLGVSIMRERAETIGATFQLESKPGEGTQIIVRYDYPIG